MVEFIPFPKIARLSREVIVTEKIDGTNAAVQIVDTDDFSGPGATAHTCGLTLYVQSRSQFITPDKDNYGFARWVRDNAEQLIGLGVGTHFGEWWGRAFSAATSYPRARSAGLYSMFIAGQMMTCGPRVAMSCRNCGVEISALTKSLRR